MYLWLDPDKNSHHARGGCDVAGEVILLTWPLWKQRKNGRWMTTVT